MQKINEKITILQGDITKLDVDAIVNAANKTLLGGGGVDEAIHRAAGSQLLAECEKLNGCETGDAKISKGYNLLARHIIHTVGPIWHGGNNHKAELLASCYRKSLELAVKNKINTMAFPAISCGIYGYPIEEATQIAVNEVYKFLKKYEKIKTVYFVCFDQEIYQCYCRILSKFND